MLRLVILSALLFGAGIAHAQKQPIKPEGKVGNDAEEAAKWYAKTNKAFQRKRYKEAAAHMREAYFHLRNPDFLYNIALSLDRANLCGDALYEYRRFLYLRTSMQNGNAALTRVAQLIKKCSDADETQEALARLRKAWTAHQENHCRDAIDFYKSYLKLGPKIPVRKRAATEAIAKLSPTCPERPPPPKQESEETRRLFDLCEVGDERSTVCEEQRQACRDYLKKDDAQRKTAVRSRLAELNRECIPPPVFHPWSVRVSGGVGKPFYSSASTTLVGNVQLEGRYWFNDKGVLYGAGIIGGFTPVQYKTIQASPEDKLAYLIDALAVAYIGYDIGTNLTVTGQVGFGLTLWGGLVQDNPFTVNGDEVSGGALSMIDINIATSIDYHFNDMFSGTFGIGYHLNPGLSGRGLKSGVLQRIEGYGGLRVRF